MSVRIGDVGDYLYTLTEPVTAPPFTISVWFKTHETDNNGCVCTIDTPDVAGYQILGCVEASGGVASDPVRAYTYNGSAYGIAVTTSGYSADTWTHACGVFTTTASRAAFKDGGSKGTNTDDRSATPSELIIHGRRRNSRVGPFLDNTASYIAEVAVWSSALSDANVALLAAGTNPQNVDAAHLIAYWTLSTDGTDSIGSNDLTEVDAGAGSLEYYPAIHPTIGGAYSYVDVAGTITGASSVTGSAFTLDVVAASGTIAGSSSVTGDAHIAANWQTDTFKNAKRLVVAASDSIYYEDI